MLRVPWQMKDDPILGLQIFQDDFFYNAEVIKGVELRYSSDEWQKLHTEFKPSRRTAMYVSGTISRKQRLDYKSKKRLWTAMTLGNRQADADSTDERSTTKESELSRGFVTYFTS